MMDETEIRFLGDVQKLSLKPSDILVFKSTECISMEAAKRLKDYMGQIVPNKVIVIDGSLEVGVLEMVGA